jgi:hypothetical protein
MSDPRHKPSPCHKPSEAGWRGAGRQRRIDGKCYPGWQCVGSAHPIPRRTSPEAKPSGAAAVGVGGEAAQDDWALPRGARAVTQGGSLLCTTRESALT